MTTAALPGQERRRRTVQKRHPQHAEVAEAESAEAEAQPLRQLPSSAALVGEDGPVGPPHPGWTAQPSILRFQRFGVSRFGVSQDLSLPYAAT